MTHTPNGYQAATDAKVRRADFDLHRHIRQLEAAVTYEAAWNGNHPTLGVYHLWIDSSGRLRIKNSAPASDTDGTVVGTQT